MGEVCGHAIAKPKLKAFEKYAEEHAIAISKAQSTTKRYIIEISISVSNYSIFVLNSQVVCDIMMVYS